MNSFTRFVAPGVFWVIVAAAFAAPMVWMVATIASHPQAMIELRLDSFRLGLLARTVSYNLAVALVATILAIPAAVALGRGRGWATRPLLVMLPLSLLLPSLAFEYGWKQALRLSNAFPRAQSAGDVARCVWTLAAWLWPVPACMGAWALRRFDVSVLEQSALDGVLGRLTLRVLLRPMLVGAAVVFVLASQEFAVFEPSGISVIATEVRMVFETGAYSSSVNPITQTFGAGTTDAMTQSARSAAALAAALPLTALTLAITLTLAWLASRWAVEGELHTGPRATLLRAPRWSTAAAYVGLAVSTITPIVAMIASHHGRLDVVVMWKTFSPQVIGSIVLAAMAMAVSLVLALGGLAHRRRAVLLLAAVCFLVGGQMLAIALIRLFNRDMTAAIYDSFAIAVLAYVSRYGWLALAAAAVTWSRPWRGLRELAAIDGATPAQTLRSVLLPLAWPLLAAAGLLVAVLSMTEVAATVLLSPQNPQPLVPMLLQWVHLQRYDAMIEGTLLLCTMVGGLAVFVVVLFGVAFAKGVRR